MILSDVNQKPIEFDENNLIELIDGITLGIFSFFPKIGVYNSIVSDSGLELLESLEIRASLINLYDYQYKRYANMDATIESKYHNQLLPVIYKKIGYVNNVVKSPDSLLFKENYKELISECRNVYVVLTSNRDLLKQISKEINELLELIRIELNK